MNNLSKRVIFAVGETPEPTSDFYYIYNELKEKYILTPIKASSDLLCDEYLKQATNALFLFFDFADQCLINNLHQKLPKAKILGFPAFIDLCNNEKKWVRGRPVFNLSFNNVVVCFTGFRQRDPLNQLALRLRWMGGSVRRNLDPDVTHLIAYHCAGSKVSQALSGGSRIKIMKSSWVSEAWARRTEFPSHIATDAQFMNRHTAKVFQQCFIAFIGFLDGSEILDEIVSLTEEHEGTVIYDLNDPRLTHVIVSDQTPRTLSFQAELSQQLSCLLVSSLGTLPTDSLKDKEIDIYEESFHDSSIAINENRLSLVSLGRPSGCNQGLVSCGCYRVPVLQLEWFWRSLQQTCLCIPNQYIYLPVSSSFANVHGVSKEFTDILLSSPVAPTIGGLEKVSEVDGETHDVEKSHSFINETNPAQKPVESKTIKTLDNRSSNSSVSTPSKPENLSTEDLLATLGDPMSFPSNKIKRDRMLQANSQSFEISPIRNKQFQKLNAALNNVEKNRQSQLNKSHDSIICNETNLLSPVSNNITESNSFLACPPQSVSSPLQRMSLSSGTRRLSQLTSLKNTSTGEYLTPVEHLSGIAETMPTLSREPTPNEIDTSYIDASSRFSTFSSPRLDLNSHQTSHSSLLKRGNSGLLNQSGERTPIQVRLERRQHRIFEFFLTESNYCDILNYLTKSAYQQVIDESQIGGSILPLKEADFVFGKLLPICELHCKLKKALDELEASWSNELSCLGPVLAPFLLEMDRVYGQYMEFYSATHLRRLGQQYPRFLAFMRQVEKRKETGRQSLNDLLVRPIQRLPSVLLLLEGIMKFTPPGHPDFPSIKDLTGQLSKILNKINERLKKNEERLSLYHLYNDISGAPVSLNKPELLSSSRTLVSQLDAFRIQQNSVGNQGHLEPVTLFLLSDSIEIVRPKRKHTGELISHALKAAIAAVQQDTGNNTTPIYDSGIPSNTGGSSSLSHSNSIGSKSLNSENNKLHTNDSISRGRFLTRKGSGASNSSSIGSSSISKGLFGKEDKITSTTQASLSAGFGLNANTDSKNKNYSYKHVQFIKLQDIRRILDLRGEEEMCIENPELCNLEGSLGSGAAFAFIIFNGNANINETDSDTTLLGFCLAASVTANYALVHGRCPEPVESVLTSTQPDKLETSNCVATFQVKVEEAKRTFLRCLSSLAVQVSCLATNPEDLVATIDYERVFSVPLNYLLSNTATGFKGKKFKRQVGRNTSIKPTTKHRLPTTGTVSSQPSLVTIFSTATLHGTNQSINDLTMNHDEESCKTNNVPSTPRRSVITNILSLGRQNHIHCDFENQSPSLSKGGRLLERHVHPLSPEKMHFAIDEMFASSDFIDKEDECRSNTRDKSRIRDVYVNGSMDENDHAMDDDYFDTLSIASSTMGSHWPAYHFQSNDHAIQLGRTASNNGGSNLVGSKNATSSSSSLRSLAGIKWGSKRLINRSSTSGLNRKSVCHTFFAGFKSIRKSLADGIGISRSNLSSSKLETASSIDFSHLTSSRSAISPSCVPTSQFEDSSENTLSSPQENTISTENNGLFLRPALYDAENDEALFLSQFRKSKGLIRDPTVKALRYSSSTAQNSPKSRVSSQSTEDLRRIALTSGSSASFMCRRLRKFNSPMNKLTTPSKANDSNQCASPSSASLINLLTSSFKRPGRKSSYHLKPNGSHFGSMISLSSLGTTSMSHFPHSFLASDSKMQTPKNFGRWGVREVGNHRVSLSSLDNNTGSAVDLGSLTKKPWSKMTAGLRVKKPGLFFRPQNTSVLTTSNSNVEINIPCQEEKENLIPKEI